MQGLVAVRHLAWLTRLPLRVSVFYLRALARAWRHRDEWTLAVATRPRELWYLLRVAQGRETVVEIGTASGWTAAALVLADRNRRVTSLDPTVAEWREEYMSLLGPEARSRLRFVQARGQEGPRIDDQTRVELLFLDGDHSCEGTIAAFEAWRPQLASDAVIAVHDFADPAHPGVTEAVHRLGLSGRTRGTLLVASLSAQLRIPAPRRPTIQHT